MGDGQEVYPWTSAGERYRFVCSKLDQWEIVFEHMNGLGLQMHVVTQETGNDQLLDGGALGLQRRLYYRELVARFSHHLAVLWNLGEENTNTHDQRCAFADRIRALDPCEHPIVVHTFPGEQPGVHEPMLGFANLDGPSMQGSLNESYQNTRHWRAESAAAGHPSFVSLDEIGPLRPASCRMPTTLTTTSFVRRGCAARGEWSCSGHAPANEALRPPSRSRGWPQRFAAGTAIRRLPPSFSARSAAGITGG